MSVIKAKGNEAKENANKRSINVKETLLRLKEGQSHKVRLLSADDYVEYQASGDYNLGIYNQPVADDSPLLVAHKHGGEKFKDLYKKSRYTFVFASLETGKLVALDVSPNQAKTLFSNIDEYEEVLGEVAFNLKRTGGKNASYSLNPIIKMKAEEQEAFNKFDGQAVELAFYEALLQPKSDDFVARLLKEAGFDVETYLPHITIQELDTDGEDVKPINEDDEGEELLAQI